MLLSISKKNFEVVDAEDADVADAAALAGGEQLHVAPPSVKIVAKRDAIMQVKYFAVCFPNGNIHLVAAVKHGASGSYMYAAHRL